TMPYAAAPEDGRTPSAWQAQALIGIAEPRTTPWPFHRQYHQLCLRWVAFDVSLGPCLMRAVPHVSIPVSFLPEWPRASQDLVRRFGSVALSGIHQPRHWYVLHEKEQMDM